MTTGDNPLTVGDKAPNACGAPRGRRAIAPAGRESSSQSFPLRCELWDVPANAIRCIRNGTGLTVRDVSVQTRSTRGAACLYVADAGNIRPARGLIVDLSRQIGIVGLIQWTTFKETDTRAAGKDLDAFARLPPPAFTAYRLQSIIQHLAHFPMGAGAGC